MDPIYDKVGTFIIERKVCQKRWFDRIFYDNLLMIDGDMPKLLEAIVNIVSTTGISRSAMLLNTLISSNPLHTAKGWEENTYRFKFGRLLYNFVLGMNEERVWNGCVPNGGFLYSSEKRCKGFSFYDQIAIGNYLITSTELFVDDFHCEFRLLGE